MAHSVFTGETLLCQRIRDGSSFNIRQTLVILLEEMKLKHADKCCIFVLCSSLGDTVTVGSLP